MLSLISLLAMSALAQEATQSPPSVNARFQTLVETIGAAGALSPELIAQSPICSVDMQRGGALLAPAAREATAHGCSAEQAAALINASIEPNTCTVVMAQGLSDSRDVDLLIQSSAGVDEDALLNTFPIVMVCNQPADQATGTAATVKLTGFSYGGSGSESSLVARIDFPVSARADVVRAIADARAAVAATTPAVSAPVVAPSLPDVDLSAADIERGVQALVNKLSQGVAQDAGRLAGFDFGQFNGANLSVCLSRFPVGEGPAAYGTLTASAREGVNGCTAEQAAALTAEIAPHSCAMLAAQQLGAGGEQAQGDIDMYVESEALRTQDTRLLSLRNDSEVSNSAVVIICNPTDTAQSATFRGLRYFRENPQGNSSQVVVTRYNFAAGPNGDGSPSAEVLQARAVDAAVRRLISHTSPEAQHYFRTASQVVGMFGLTGVDLSQTPVCRAIFPNDAQGAGRLEISGREGLHACVEPGRRARRGTPNPVQDITANIPAGQCAIVVAEPINPAHDLDLHLRRARPGAQDANAFTDADMAAYVMGFQCNTGRRPQPLIVMGRVFHNPNRVPADQRVDAEALIYRINIPVPQGLLDAESAARQQLPRR